MIVGIRKVGFQLCVEYAFLFLIIAGIAHTAWFFYVNKYLPQPFFYEPWGTFMDWYSLSYWGSNRGAYDIERTIYPPISFVTLKLFSISSCYPNSIGEPSRDCDPIGAIALVAMFFINIGLTFISFRKLDKSNFIPRAAALSMGLPMLYGLERGNLLLFCYACVVLAFGPLLYSARWRWFFGGMAVNFKVYLVAAIMAPLLHRRWLQTEGMIVYAALVFIATWLILGEGSPAQVVGNIMSYASTFGASRVLDMWYASSFVPAISLLRGDAFPILTILDSDHVSSLLIAAQFLLYSTQVLIVLSALATWLRPDLVPINRSLLFAITLALISSEAGGYTEILLFFFVFQERWKGYAIPVAICIAYFMCIPFEIVGGKVNPIVRVSWLAQTEVIADYGIGIIAILRPVLKSLIIWLLAFVTLRDVFMAIRKDGLPDILRPRSR